MACLSLMKKICLASIIFFTGFLGEEEDQNHCQKSNYFISFSSAAFVSAFYSVWAMSHLNQSWLYCSWACFGPFPETRMNLSLITFFTTVQHFSEEHLRSQSQKKPIFFVFCSQATLPVKLSFMVDLVYQNLSWKKTCLATFQAQQISFYALTSCPNLRTTKIVFEQVISFVHQGLFLLLTLLQLFYQTPPKMSQNQDCSSSR